MSGLSSANVSHLTYGYRNRTIISISIGYSLGTLAVVLRFTARKMVRAGIWLDDWLSLVGLVCCDIILQKGLPNDAAIRGEPIPESILIDNAKTVYVAELFYYISQFTLKASILAFYWRLFKTSSIRLPIYAVAGFVVMWFIATILIVILQCLPIASIWVPALRPSAKCIDLAPFFFATSIPNIVADLLLLVLPMPYIWRLKITFAQKLCVTGLLLLGGFVLIVSAIRLRLLLLLDIRGFYANWAVENSVFWTGIESCMSIICVCLPSLRPVVKLLPWGSCLGKSLISGNDSKPSMGVPESEYSIRKTKDTQNDEYELLERDNGCFSVQTEDSAKENSVRTIEAGCITVQTNIHVSSL
ncbi:hypothetical protein BKA66DRAFT_581799 [Pyrenochaeta sp. MPI-SDFR-AT-0127]|nr:hypothetical protein BKA66DRAFT_581799 [Pyrenochaeta sp. MPI-SDFR-AT-0127]